MLRNLSPLWRRSATRVSRSKKLRIEALEPRVVPAAFTPGNVVVYRVGDGAASLTNTGVAVFLDEFDPAGNLVQSVAMPTTVSGSNKQLISTGTAAAEGLITRSQDGQFLVMTGYARDLGQSGSLTSSASAVVNRTIGLVKFDGTVDTSTALSDAIDGKSPTSAISVDGTDLWIAGGGDGIRHTSVGSSTSTEVSTTVTNLRQLGIFDGQLYVSTSSNATVRIGTVGTGVPSGSGETITNLPGFQTSGSAFAYYFADLDAGVAGLDTLYVADPGGGLEKYSLFGGNWIQNGAIGISTDVYRGITGIVTGTTVSLYAVRLGGGELVKIVDTAGYNVNNNGSVTILATAATNTAFRGVVTTPEQAALPENQPPENTLPSSFSTSEDTGIPLTGISIADPDAGTADVKVTLSVPSGEGTLTIATGVSGGIEAGDISNNGNGTHVIEITSTLAKINATLGDSNGLIYSPANNAFGDVILTLVTDDLGNIGSGGAKSDTDTATITINPVADTPSVTNSTTNEDTQTTTGLVITPDSVDGSEVTHYKLSNIANGTLFQNDGSTPINAGDFITVAQGAAGLKFTPASNYFGNATFDVQASLSNSDAGLGGSTVTATITVNPVADTPSVTNSTTNEDTQTTTGLVITPDSVDGSEVTHYKISAIANGTLFQNDGSTPINAGDFITVAQGAAGLKFTPASNYFGNATFDVQASLSNSDAGLGGSIVTATITVNPVADTPSVTNATTDEDTQTTTGLVITPNSVDGSEVTHFKVSNIANGTLFQNDGSTPINAGDFITVAQGAAGLKFTPASNYFGNATFDVQASLSNSDAGLGGSIVTATITVNPIADTPSVTNSTTNEDTQTTTGLVITPNSVDGSEVTHYKISAISNGSLFQNDGSTPINAGDFITVAQGAAGLKFTPASNYFGNATFDVQASLSNSDAGLGGSIVTATITVNPVADTPSVTNATTDEDTQTTTGLVIAPNAEDGNEVTHYKISAIANGTLFQNDASTPINAGDFITVAQGVAGLKFTPSEHFNGTGSFQIQAAIGNSPAGLGGSLVTANVTVNAVNDGPAITRPASYTTDEDVPIVLSGLAIADVDADSSAVLVQLTVDSGTLALKDSVSGGVNFTQILGNGGAQVTILAPISQLNATLADMNGLQFFPTLNAVQNVNFTVVVDDLGNSGSGGSLFAFETIGISVTSINDAPTVNAPGTVGTEEDTPFHFVGDFEVNVFDVDFVLGTETIQVVLSTTHGVAEMSNTAGLTISGNGSNSIVASGLPTDMNAALGTLFFTPELDYFGAAEVSFEVNDLGQSGLGGPLSDSKITTVIITPANDAPILGDYTFDIPANIALNSEIGTLVATDAEGDAISYAITAGNSDGKFAIDPAGKLTIVDNINLISLYVLTITATDDGTPNRSDTGTVTINVNTAPITNGIADRTVDEDDTANFPIEIDLGAAFDDLQETDAELVYSLEGNTNPGLFSSLTIVGTTLAMTPAIDAFGESTLTVRATDLVGNFVETSFKVTVTPVNDAPTLDLIADLDIDEDAGTQSIPLAGVSVGPANEAAAGQTITSIVAVSSNPSLIPNPNVIFDSGSYFLEFAPTENSNGTAEITVTVTDSGTGTHTFERTFTVDVVPQADSPILDTGLTPMLPAITLFPPKVLPTGSFVGELLAGVSDADVGASKGMAITGVVDSNGKNVKRGTWQFSLDNGTNWNDIVGVSATNALVLPDDGNARIRFLPIKKTKGFFSISYRAWDQSNAATPGSLVDPSGDAAFSSTIERAWVGLGKTKPVVNEFGQTVLRAVKEDRKASRVFQVKAVLGIAGLETPANFGIAIVAASTSDGHWEYRLAKSKAWVAVDNVSASSALLLGPKDKLRFFPNANADGEGSISFLTWNETGGTTGSKVDPTGDPAFGTDPGTATLDIIAINDAPTLTPIVSTLNSVAPGETTNEVVFASLFTGTDVEGVAIGVAITSISGKGIWEYRSAGGQWTLIERASGRRPLLLEADAELRFTADVNAKPGKAKLSFKSWDKTLGTSGNTEKAGRLSKATAKLSVTIG